MKVKSFTYAMLRSTAPYENDRAEVTIEPEAHDSLGDVVRFAKRACESAFHTPTAVEPTFEALMLDGVATPTKKQRR